MLIHATADISEEDYNNIVGGKTGQLCYFTSDDESPMKSIYVDLKRTDELNIDTKGIELFNKKIEPGQVILFKFDSTLVDASEANYIRELLSVTYPDNIVIGIVDDVKLLVSNPNEAIDMLEKMIAHIKIQSGLPEKSISSSLLH